MTTEQGRTMPKRLGSLTRQRKRVWRHEERNHDLAYKEFGTEYRRVYVEKFAIEVAINVGKSDAFDTIEAGIFCLTCDRWLATWDVVDEYY